MPGNELSRSRLGRAKRFLGVRLAGSYAVLDTSDWFLRRPALYPQFVRNMRDAIVPPRRDPREYTRDEATAWAASRAISVPDALRALTGAPPMTPLRTSFGSIFAVADAAAANCPVTMGGPGELDLLYGLAEHLAARRVVETGVAYGWSSLAILLSLRNRPGARLISTDMPYLHRGNDAYVGCVVPAELRSFWTIRRCADRDALPRVLRRLGAIDLCHYDSDKSYAGRCWGYPRLWAALRPGGLFVSDDIGDNVAFRDFALQVEAEPMVVAADGKYVGVLRRPGGSQPHEPV